MRKSILETGLPNTDHDDGGAVLDNYDKIIAKKLEENPLYLDEGIKSVEAARVMDSTVGTLANQRSKGIGPKYLRLGSAIRYTRRMCLEYMYGED
jgi:hypothetical protein